MSPPRKSEEEVAARREEILDAAYAILKTEGPEAISSRAIAERMGIAHMSLYTYFDNQAAILRALSERELFKIRSHWQVFEERAQSEDIAQLMKEALAFYVAFARENPNLYRLAWVMPEVGGESAEKTRLRMQNTVGLLADLLDLGMKRGAFAVRDPFLAAATMLGMVNMPFILFHSGRLADPDLRDRMVEEVLSAVMCYLREG